MMNSRLFFLSLLGLITMIAVSVYIFRIPPNRNIELIGVITGNEVIVRPQISASLVHLLVDEGSEVKRGQLIAELDSAELTQIYKSALAAEDTLQAKVLAAQRTLNWTNDQTQASVVQAQATREGLQAQREQSQANLWRDQNNYNRKNELYQAGVASAQDFDVSSAALRASTAAVKSFERQVSAQEALIAVAIANRKQLDIQRSEIDSAKAQLAEAKATTAQAAVRLGYTKIYSPLDGIVSVRVVSQGEMVSEGDPIVTIIDVDKLWVQTNVEEGLIAGIDLKSTLNIRLPSGEVVNGTVFFRGVENNYATQRDVSRTKRDIKTFSIKVAIPNREHHLVTGMTATVLLPKERKNVASNSILTGQLE